MARLPISRLILGDSWEDVEIWHEAQRLRKVPASGTVLLSSQIHVFRQKEAEGGGHFSYTSHSTSWEMWCSPSNFKLMVDLMLVKLEPAVVKLWGGHLHEGNFVFCVEFTNSPPNSNMTQYAGNSAHWMQWRLWLVLVWISWAYQKD